MISERETHDGHGPGRVPGRRGLSFSRKDPVPTAANPDSCRTMAVACASIAAEPPDPDARGPSDDVRDDDGDDDGDSADDPAEAANRDPLLRLRPQRRPALVRQRASLVERVEPSSGDRPGCRLIRGSFEADRPYLSSPVHPRFLLLLLPQSLRRRSMISVSCASPFHKPVNLIEDST